MAVCSAAPRAACSLALPTAAGDDPFDHIDNA